MQPSPTHQRHSVRGVVPCALLSVAGMTHVQIARAYDMPESRVRREMARLYRGLGMDDCSRIRLLPHLVRAGYLDCLYVLLCLIQRGETDAAVTLVEMIVTEQ